MKTENWCGNSIRFVEKNGEWWAILKDICDALDLRTDGVSQRLDSDMMIRVPVETEIDIPSRYNVKDYPDSNGVNFTRARKTVNMIAVNELGIYEALFTSRKLEARKLRRWTATVLQRLRKHVGLEGYEVMKMTEQEVQEDIDHFLDTIFWDEEKGQLMRSVTIQGGDTDQIPVDFNQSELVGRMAE